MESPSQEKCEVQGGCEQKRFPVAEMVASSVSSEGLC